MLGGELTFLGKELSSDIQWGGIHDATLEYGALDIYWWLTVLVHTGHSSGEFHGNLSPLKQTIRNRELGSAEDYYEPPESGSWCYTSHNETHCKLFSVKMLSLCKKQVEVSTLV